MDLRYVNDGIMNHKAASQMHPYRTPCILTRNRNYQQQDLTPPPEHLCGFLHLASSSQTLRQFQDFQGYSEPNNTKASSCCHGLCCSTTEYSDERRTTHRNVPKAKSRRNAGSGGTNKYRNTYDCNQNQRRNEIRDPPSIVGTQKPYLVENFSNVADVLDLSNYSGYDGLNQYQKRIDLSTGEEFKRANWETPMNVDQREYRVTHQVSNTERKQGNTRNVVDSVQLPQLYYEELPYTAMENKRRDVLKAAKALFSKRTRTLYHWMNPAVPTKTIKASAQMSWDDLPEWLKNEYISQVEGKFGMFSIRPMINPQVMNLPELQPAVRKRKAHNLTDPAITNKPKQIRKESILNDVDNTITYKVTVQPYDDVATSQREAISECLVIEEGWDQALFDDQLFPEVRI